MPCNILRILQEAFANILKHSGARQVTVSIRAESDQVLVRVQDDGQGFDPALPARGGRGLTNQLRRAEAIGGTILWEPSDQGASPGPGPAGQQAATPRPNAAGRLRASGGDERRTKAKSWSQALAAPSTLIDRTPSQARRIA
ncbi:sensor histidine kinase [Caulobacter segnis]